MELVQDEKIYFDVLAKLFVVIESIGGKLKVTNKRLYFEYNNINIQPNVIEIMMEQISEAKKWNTLVVVPNGMEVILKDGTKLNFVILNREKLIKFINENKFNNQRDWI